MLTVVLDKGEPVVASLVSACKEQGVRAGSLTGLGAVNSAEIAYYDLSKKEYLNKHFEGDREVVSLVGNVAVVDDEPFLHVHIALGDREMQIVGGHLVEATVAVTLEVSIQIIPDTTSERTLDDSIGLKLLQLPKE